MISSAGFAGVAMVAQKHGPAFAPKKDGGNGVVPCGDALVVVGDAVGLAQSLPREAPP